MIKIESKLKEKTTLKFGGGLDSIEWSELNQKGAIRTGVN